MVVLALERPDLTLRFWEIFSLRYPSIHEMEGEVHHVPVRDDTDKPVVLIGDRNGPEIISGKTCRSLFLACFRY